MLYQIFAIAIKEFKILMRDRGAFSGLFIQPVAFILVMTVALQGLFNSGSPAQPIKLLVVNQDRGALAAQVIDSLRSAKGLALVETLDDKPITRAAAEQQIVSGDSFIALVFPADFSDNVLLAARDAAAAQAVVDFIVDPGVGQQLLLPLRGMVEGAMQREVALAQSPIRMANSFEVLAASAPEAQAGLIRQTGEVFLSAMDPALTGSTQSSGFTTQVVTPAQYVAVKFPTSAQQNVPGYTIYGVFFIITDICTGIFREKDEGTFRRLQATPISRIALLIGKMLPYYAVNLIQIALMLTIGTLVFRFNLGVHPAALIPVALASAATATGLGLMIAALGKTREQVSSFSTILTITLSAMGGLMVPILTMPEFMQKLSLAIPHAWAMTGFQDVIVRGKDLAGVMPAVGVLMLFTIVFWGIGLWRLRLD